jgi:hypothetical protein
LDFNPLSSGFFLLGYAMHQVTQWDMIGRLALSALLGSFIGAGNCGRW